MGFYYMGAGSQTYLPMFVWQILYQLSYLPSLPLFFSRMASDVYFLYLLILILEIASRDLEEKTMAAFSTLYTSHLYLPATHIMMDGPISLHNSCVLLM